MVGDGAEQVNRGRAFAPHGVPSPAKAASQTTRARLCRGRAPRARPPGSRPGRHDTGMPSTRTLWTIGHSTREWDVFTGMLREAGIEALADVRRYPGSRRNPQFSAEAMGAALPEAGIAFVAMPALGGRRAPRKDSPNTAWRNVHFRGYADYMDTGDYQAARDRLAELATARRTAVMCAEAMWWQCHRSLIADDFKAAGWTVLHLMQPSRTEEHPYTGAARIVDGRLDYSPEGPRQRELL